MEETVIRILLLSDSHGDQVNMVTAVRRVKPDMILHLGDCYRDAKRLHSMFPDIPMHMVIGNCDWGNQAPAEQILDIEGYKVLMCHGHAYNVKMTLLQLELTAKEKGVDVVLFGHTHQVFYDWYNGLAMFNPGSIGNPRPGIPPSYGILTLGKELAVPKMETGYIE